MKKIPHKILTVVLLSMASLILYAGIALGQGVLGADINITIQPRNPVSGGTVTVTLESFSTDLNQANIRWYVNENLRGEGRALKTFGVVAGALGTIQVVEAVIETIDIGSVTKRVVIAPAEVEIVEQADSFVPPFYKGKALTPPEGRVTLIALPTLVTESGRKLSTNEINFKWKKNGTVLGNESGLGRNQLTVTAPYVDLVSIYYEVEASAPEYNLIATKTHFIQPGTPHIVFYENNPLLGIIYRKALRGTYTLNKDEIAITAYPFSFGSRVTSDSDTNFSWSINNSVVDSGQPRNTITLRRPPGVSGVSQVSLSIENVRRVFESASESLQINLGSNQSVTF